MERRDFIKITGAGALALGAAAAGCTPKKKTAPVEEGSGEMVYRVNPVNGERCIGCGACENLCPARPISAITVNGRHNHLNED